MATITHKIKFIADFKVVTRQLARAAKALDTTVPGLQKFLDMSLSIEATWEKTATAIKSAQAAVKSVATGGGKAAAKAAAGADGGAGGGSKPRAPAGKRKLPMGLTMGGRVLAGAGGALLAGGVVAAGRAVGGAVAGAAERGNAAAKSKVFSIKQYQRLSAAAELSGADIKQVEATALKLNTTLTKSKLDPEFSRGLQALGLTAKDLKGMAPERQLGLIGDRLNDFKDPALKAAAANKLFGDSGAQMLPFLSAGSAGLQKAGDDAERFGLVMSDDAAHNAEAFNDQLSMLSMRAEGVGTQVATAVMPALIGLAEGLGDLMDDAGPGLGQLAELVGGVLVRAVEFLQGTFEELQALVGPLVSGFLAEIGPVLGAGFDIAADAVSGCLEILGFILEMFGLTGEGAEQTGAALADTLAAAFEWVGATVDIVLDTLGAFSEILMDVIDLFFGVSDGGGFVTEVFSGIGSAALDITQGALLTLYNMLVWVSELFASFGEGGIIEGFKKLGSGLLDFILEPLRLIVGTVVSIADALGGDDLIPDSVREFADNSKVKEFANEASEKRAEKTKLRAITAADVAEKKSTAKAEREAAKREREAAKADRDAQKRGRDTERVGAKEGEVSAKRMAALGQEGRKVSGPGLIQLGARDAKGRDLAVYLGNRERRDLAAALLGPAGAGPSMGPQMAAGLAAGPVLAGLAAPQRTALAPALGGMGGGAAPGIHVEVNLELTIEGGAATADTRELAGQFREICRDEIATQVLRAVRQVNPGNIYQ